MLGMMCGGCEKEQNLLLEEGDGSQVECTHMCDEEGDGSQVKFPLDSDFDAIPPEEVTPKPWRNIAEERKTYHVEKTFDIPLKDGQTAMILHLTDRERKKEVVWATSLIQTELKMYDLTRNDIFIKPMGTKKSCNGYKYFSFRILCK